MQTKTNSEEVDFLHPSFLEAASNALHYTRDEVERLHAQAVQEGWDAEAEGYQLVLSEMDKEGSDEDPIE